jgi:tetratricopeptide (TPR) repeat protein
MTYLKQAIQQHTAGLYTEAIESYSRAIEIDPNFALAYLDRGLTYRILKEYEKANNDFNKAIELHFEPVSTPYYQRGLIGFDQGHYNEAIVDLTKAIDLKYSPPSEIYSARGAAYIQQGKYEQATADLLSFA